MGGKVRRAGDNVSGHNGSVFVPTAGCCRLVQLYVFRSVALVYGSVAAAYSVQECSPIRRLIPRLAAQWILAIGAATVLILNLLIVTMLRQQTYRVQVFPATPSNPILS